MNENHQTFRLFSRKKKIDIQMNFKFKLHKNIDLSGKKGVNLKVKKLGRAQPKGI